MVRTVIQIEDGENVYKEGDRVRIKMQSNHPDPERANEYIGTVKNIHGYFIILDCDIFERKIDMNKIDKMRFAREGESFLNTWNFDD